MKGVGSLVYVQEDQFGEWLTLIKEAKTDI